MMELHHANDEAQQMVWSSIKPNCRALLIELWIVDLHKSNNMELTNSNHESP